MHFINESYRRVGFSIGDESQALINSPLYETPKMRIYSLNPQQDEISFFSLSTYYFYQNPKKI